MLRFTGFLLCLGLIIFSLQGQGRKGLPEYERLYRAALELYTAENGDEKTDSLALENFRASIGIMNAEKIHPSIMPDAYLKCGILLMTKTQWDTALQYLRESVSSVGRGSELSDSLSFQPLLYMGSIHYELNQPDSAVWFYKKAENILNRYGALEESERLYNKFGALYYETGDYAKSINYFQKAVAIISESGSPNPYFLVNYKNNIAAAYLKLGRYTEAVDIFRELLPYRIAEDQLLHNLGNTFLEEGSYKEALRYLGMIREKGLSALNSMTRAYILMGRKDSAKLYLDKAIKFAEAGKAGKAGVKDIDLGVAWKNAGDISRIEGKPEEAVYFYQRSILRTDPGFTDSSIQSNPTHFRGLMSFSLLFDALAAKAAALREVDSMKHSRQALEESLNAFQSAISLASHIERTYFSDDARLFLKKKVGPVIQDAVDIALSLHAMTGQREYLEQAFAFAENQKASVLQAGIKRLELSSIPGIPSGLLQEEKNFKAQITRLAILSEKETDSAVLEQMRKRMLDLDIGLSAVQEKLDENQQYHQLKFGYVQADFDTLVKRFSQGNSALLSYYFTKNKLICFFVTGQGTGVSSLGLDSSLFTEISLLRSELESPESSGSRTLQERGARLYRMLLKPVAKKLEGREKLVVIPCNEIAYIPFELLFDEEKGKTLLESFDISYNYSANFIPGEESPVGSGYQVLALAPFSGEGVQNLALPALPASAKEIDGLPGKILKNAAATKSAFETFSGRFPVIHLATHAVANDEDPVASFVSLYGKSGDADTLYRLYEQEILNLDMHSANLLILSACETGKGKLVNGEGIISLSRAFSYAGCKSVITSLWKADDISTAFIIGKLHKYLKEGMTKDHALRMAKLDYIRSGEVEGRFKNPAYWAHLVLIGDSGPLVRNNNRIIMIFLFGLMTALAAFLLIRKKNRA